MYPTPITSQTPEAKDEMTECDSSSTTSKHQCDTSYVTEVSTGKDLLSGDNHSGYYF
jgi:hypothetical protein